MSKVVILVCSQGTTNNRVSTKSETNLQQG